MDDLLTPLCDPVQDVRKWKRSSCVLSAYRTLSTCFACRAVHSRIIVLCSLPTASFVLQSYLSLQFVVTYAVALFYDLFVLISLFNSNNIPFTPPPLFAMLFFSLRNQYPNSFDVKQLEHASHKNKKKNNRMESFAFPREKPGECIYIIRCAICKHCVTMGMRTERRIGSHISLCSGKLNYDGKKIS